MSMICPFEALFRIFLKSWYILPTYMIVTCTDLGSTILLQFSLCAV